MILNKEIERIKTKLPDGFKDLPGSGWNDIIIKLNRKLEMLDPDYEILQIKEKFGSLRFYYKTDCSLKSIKEAMDRYVRFAEMESIQTCEECGRRGKLAKRNPGWMKTLCDNCLIIRTPVRNGNEEHTR